MRVKPQLPHSARVPVNDSMGASEAQIVNFDVVSASGATDGLGPGMPLGDGDAGDNEPLIVVAAPIREPNRF